MDKKEVKQLLVSKLLGRVSSLRSEMNDIVGDASAQAKSSAGDKHETANAMANLERERLAGQLDTCQRMLFQAEKLPEATSYVVSAGALVQTNYGYFYISEAFGKLTYDGETIMAISASSPLVQMASGKAVGDTFKMGPVTHTIKAVS